MSAVVGGAASGRHRVVGAGGRAGGGGPDPGDRGGQGGRSGGPGSALRIGDRSARIAIALAVVAAAGAAVLHAAVYRAAEAWCAAALLDPVVMRGSRSWQDLYLVWTGPHQLIAFQVTIECTSLILVVPLAVIAAALLAATRVPWWRFVVGLGAALTTAFLVNEVRLAAIAWASQRWGMDNGYRISHEFVGSVIGVVGFALGLALLVLVMGVRAGRGRS